MDLGGFGAAPAAASRVAMASVRPVDFFLTMSYSDPTPSPARGGRDHNEDTLSISSSRDN
jgi:hypothetical protein